MKSKLDFDTVQIGARLKDVRTALKLSLEKISDSTGFSRSLVSEAENGKKKPSSVYLHGLHSLYNVNINYILSGEGERFLYRPGEFGENEQNEDTEMLELLFLLKNVKFVKFAMLSHFIDFKTRNKDVIKELLKDLKNQKK